MKKCLSSTKLSTYKIATSFLQPTYVITSTTGTANIGNKDKNQGSNSYPLMTQEILVQCLAGLPTQLQEHRWYHRSPTPMKSFNTLVSDWLESYLLLVELRIHFYLFLDESLSIIIMNNFDVVG